MEIHVCYPTNMRYIARVRPFGHRKYRVMTYRKSFERALQDLTKTFDRRVHKRGDVLMLSDWYDPVPIVELVRR